MKKLLFVLSLSLLYCSQLFSQNIPEINGYHGIWFDLGQYSDYGPKYSGGLGTYTAKHIPLAIYCEKSNTTYFVYGGTIPGQRHLLAMIGAYDHKTQSFSKPTMVHDKQGVDDPHDDPSISMDAEGYIWIFVSGRAKKRMGYIYKSSKPFSIDAFDRIIEDEFTYPQPWWVPEKGFIHLFTRYTHGRELYWSTSSDGKTWVEPQKLAGMGGHYQLSNTLGHRTITAFNMHPGGNVDVRTNLYFVQTTDMGKTWTTIDGKNLTTPLADISSPALIRDYRSEGFNVYLKDINFDKNGNPIILHITSRSHQPGPVGGQRAWRVAHWEGQKWQFNIITTSTHNYDMGSLYIDGDTWRVIGPTETGPQTFGAGGEIAVWESTDQGNNWKLVNKITHNSQYNHNYVRRPVNAHPDFYAFWADGNPWKFSPSRLYKMDKHGNVTPFPSN